MAKTIRVKCTHSIAPKFAENNMYNVRVNDEGQMSVTVFCKAENKKKRIELSMSVCGEIFVSGVGGVVAAKFVELKTKTLKCIALDHKNPVKKSFTVGKRYQVESGRALGGVAGYIFDNEGCRWTLFREEVGFSIADGTTFEAKYL